MPEECLKHLMRIWKRIMKSSFLTLDEAVVLLRKEIEMKFDHEDNEVKRRKLWQVIHLIDSFNDVYATLEVVLRFWPGLMLSFVEALYDESCDLRGLMILELINVDAVVETLKEELAESIEDSE